MKKIFEFFEDVNFDNLTLALSFWTFRNFNKDQVSTWFDINKSKISDKKGHVPSVKVRNGLEDAP